MEPILEETEDLKQRVDETAEKQRVNEEIKQKEEIAHAKTELQQETEKNENLKERLIEEMEEKKIFQNESKNETQEKERSKEELKSTEEKLEEIEQKKEDEIKEDKIKEDEIEQKKEEQTETKEDETKEDQKVDEEKLPTQIDLEPFPDLTEEKEELVQFRNDPDYLRFKELIEFQEKFYKNELNEQKILLTNACAKRVMAEIAKVEEALERIHKRRLEEQGSLLNRQCESEKEQLALRYEHQALVEIKNQSDRFSKFESVLQEGKEVQEYFIQELAYSNKLQKISALVLNLSNLFDQRYISPKARLDNIREQWELLRTHVTFDGVLEEMVASIPTQFFKEELFNEQILKEEFPDVIKELKKLKVVSEAKNNHDNEPLLSTLLRKTRNLQGLEAGTSFGRAEWYLMDRSDLESSLFELKKDPNFEFYRSHSEVFSRWVSDVENNLLIKNTFNRIKSFLINLLEKK